MSRRLDGGSQRAQVPALPAPERGMSRRLDGGSQRAQVPALPAQERGTAVDALMRWEWEGGAPASVRDRDQVKPSPVPRRRREMRSRLATDGALTAYRKGGVDGRLGVSEWEEQR